MICILDVQRNQCRVAAWPRRTFGCALFLLRSHGPPPLSLKDRLREQHHPTHATAGPYLRNLVLLRRWQPLPLGEGGRKPMSKHQTAASTYSLIKTKRKADFELTKQVLNRAAACIRLVPRAAT
jgi:hypothetical protein